MQDATITTPRRTPVATGVGILAALEAATFFLASLLHLGLPIPPGFAVLAEPRIIPAATVEGLCGLALTVAAYAAFTGRAWAWPAAIAAHVIAPAGVLLGMVALAAGRGPRTELNDAYHQVMLVMLLLGLALLSTPIARAALGRGNRARNGGSAS
jgi:hypothetical protein